MELRNGAGSKTAGSFHDKTKNIKNLSKWIASLDDGREKEKIALHLSRYFPRFLMDVPATDVALIFRLKELAEKEIRYVFAGNC